MVKRIKALVKLVCVLFILILHADATASAEEGNIMNGLNDYQQRQLEAIHILYKELKMQSQKSLSLKDVVVAWFTEGHAEKFRSTYLENHPVFM